MKRLKIIIPWSKFLIKLSNIQLCFMKLYYQGCLLNFKYLDIYFLASFLSSCLGSKIFDVVVRKTHFFSETFFLYFFFYILYYIWVKYILSGMLWFLLEVFLMKFWHLALIHPYKMWRTYKNKFYMKMLCPKWNYFIKT